MFLVTLLSAAEIYFVSSLGTDAIAAGGARHPCCEVQSIVCCVMGLLGSPSVTGLQVQ